MPSYGNQQAVSAAGSLTASRCVVCGLLTPQARLNLEAIDEYAQSAAEPIAGEGPPPPSNRSDAEETLRKLTSAVTAVRAAIRMKESFPALPGLEWGANSPLQAACVRACSVRLSRPCFA